MASNENVIQLKTITDLLGMNFYIPEYQRGYRWTKHNVGQLLDDIWEYRQASSNRNSFYCLQPVVVRELTWDDLDGNKVNGYELIDGQQRLTTIHRILTCIMLERYGKLDLIARGYERDLFSIYYKTRLESKDFLVKCEYNDSKPDLYYMSEAYVFIKEWLNDKKRGIPDDTMDEIRRILLPGIIKDADGLLIQPEWSVQVIWYEINDKNQKSEDLFTRLNRGKIPLTSAELIKAKFVNSDSFSGIPEKEKIKRRTQLIQIWDEIENHLNNPKFWAFISNEPLETYSSKIEYLFDVKTGKNRNEKDPLYSFIHFFDAKESENTLWEKWLQVEEIYRSLVFWYSDKDLYHKIGYLIATGISVREIVSLKKSKTKDQFRGELDEKIATSIPDNWEGLRYDNQSDHSKIINVLLLMNIELTRRNENSNEFFPFEAYKDINKSLEHIHAQNIEEIDSRKREHWENWLNAHTSILPTIALDQEKAKEVVEKVEMAQTKDNFSFEDFKKLSVEILDLMPMEKETEFEYLHKIENMALLGLTENISLSNSVFEVKRRKIMEMEMDGAFIPIGTRRVFLKYYSDPASSQHYSVWTKDEREKYLDEIAKCIGQYKQEMEVLNEN